MRLAVSLLRIPVRDLSQSIRFYETALSLQAKFVTEEFGWAQLDGATLAIALYVPGHGGGKRTPGGSVDFHLSHDDIGGLLISVHKVAPDAAVYENTDGARSLDFTDPDGNCVKVIERQ